MSKFIKINPQIPFTNDKLDDDKYININTIEQISKSDKGGTFVNVNYNELPFVLSEKFENFINRLNSIVNE